jgi:CrcB protein
MPLRTPPATALVAAGGAAGAAARWALAAPAAPGAFPVRTLLANVAGAGLLGYLVGRVPVRGGRSEALRLFLGTGVLGGFTTFSAFAVELWHGAPAGYAVLSVAGGVAAAVVGLAAGAMGATE